MEIWYFSIIGVPIVISFVISFIVYIVYSKLMHYELVDPTTGKGRYRCKGSEDTQPKKNINFIAPDGRP